MKLHLTICILVCSLHVGCSDKVSEYRVDASGKMTYMGSFTEEENWKRSQQRKIDAEAAGEHPFNGKETWREYWQWRYALLRENPKPYYKSTQIKTCEDEIRWIEQQRTAKGLPPYDVQLNDAL